MRKFQCNKWMFLFYASGVVVMGMCPLVLAIVLKSLSIGERLLLGSIGLFVVLMLGRLLLDYAASYEVDENHIVRRGWNGERTMRWDFVTKVHGDGTSKISITLIDNLDHRLPIVFQCLSDRDSADLRDLIAPRIAKLRANPDVQLHSLNSSYHPRRSIFLQCSFGLWGLAGLLFLCKSTNGGSMSETAADLFFVASGTVLILLGLWVFAVALTECLRITEHGLVKGSLFGSKTLLYSDVVEINTTEVVMKGEAQYDRTTVTGSDGSKILLFSSMPDYQLIMKYVRARVPQSAVRHEFEDGPSL